MKKLMFISFLIIIAFLGCEEEQETWQVSLVNESDSVYANLEIGGMLLSADPGKIDSYIFDEDSYNWDLTMFYADSIVIESGSFVLDMNAACYIWRIGEDFGHDWIFGE